MRLLKINAEGELSLVEYIDEQAAPSYAILSHRWGEDHEEVTLKDFIDGSGQNKKGYEKIVACGKQATKDKLEYFWIDTCCIDKTSSAELSESINSMWRWYRRATLCYAYLNDVPARVEYQEQLALLAQSKWFTRGWTLQELLAPSTVILYDAAWESIGSKNELAKTISRATGIDEFYLSSNSKSPGRASVAEKMSWASTRTTKRQEDVAYSLLGLFGISMPLLYGEGNKAFLRLQEEIIKQSDDQSILAWNLMRPHEAVPLLYSSLSGTFHAIGCLARSPAAFCASRDIVRSVNPGPPKPYTVTNMGLQIELPLLKFEGKLFAGLNCRHANDFFSDLAIPIRKVDIEHRYARSTQGVRLIPISEWKNAKPETIYLILRNSRSSTRSDPKDGSIVIRSVPEGYNITEVFPNRRWFPESRTIANCINEEVELDTKARILIRLASTTSDQINLIISYSWSRLLREWMSEARILPSPGSDTSEMSDLYTQWQSKSLSRLPRRRNSAAGALMLQAADLMIRDRRLTVLDLTVCTAESNAFQEYEDQIKVLWQYTSRRIRFLFSSSLPEMNRNLILRWTWNALCCVWIVSIWQAKKVAYTTVSCGVLYFVFGMLGHKIKTIYIRPKSVQGEKSDEYQTRWTQLKSIFILFFALAAISYCWGIYYLFSRFSTFR
jgi:hypothetical protein